MNIARHNNGTFSTSVYRKPTYTGLTTSFFSFIPGLYKINGIRILIFRAYHLSSTYFSFSKELQYLESMLVNNGYPQKLFQKYVSKFLNSINTPSKPLLIAPKHVIYISLPYLGPPSHKLAKQLKSFKLLYFRRFQVCI